MTYDEYMTWQESQYSADLKQCDCCEDYVDTNKMIHSKISGYRFCFECIGSEKANKFIIDHATDQTSEEIAEEIKEVYNLYIKR